MTTVNLETTMDRGVLLNELRVKLAELRKQLVARWLGGEAVSKRR